MRCVAEEAPIFASTTALDVCRVVKAGCTVTVAGTVELTRGRFMVPITPHGAVQWEYFNIIRQPEADQAQGCEAHHQRENCKSVPFGGEAPPEDEAKGKAQQDPERLLRSEACAIHESQGQSDGDCSAGAGLEDPLLPPSC